MNFKKTFALLIGALLITLLSTLPKSHHLLAQYTESKVYWAYKRDQNDGNYVLQIDRASDEGILLGDQDRTLAFKMLFSEAEYRELRAIPNQFPVNVQWYRYNRAKPTIFAVHKVQPQDISSFQKNGQTYYRLTSVQEQILSGTWVVKVTDALGNALRFENQTEFEVIVL